MVLEKPVALNAMDYQEILNVAYANNKFLLDGTMLPHHERTRLILDCVTDEAKVGRVDRIETNFSFLGGDDFDGSNIRTQKDGDPQGCIGDLGWYCIRYGLMVFGKLGSKAVNARVLDWTLNKHGVPVDATCVVRFEHVSSLVESECVI